MDTKQVNEALENLFKTDLRIKLDLDDGVKVNYGKFSDPDYGDILADVKAICGTKDEE